MNTDTTQIVSVFIGNKHQGFNGLMKKGKTML